MHSDELAYPIRPTLVEESSIQSTIVSDDVELSSLPVGLSEESKLVPHLYFESSDTLNPSIIPSSLVKRMTVNLDTLNPSLSIDTQEAVKVHILITDSIVPVLEEEILMPMFATLYKEDTIVPDVVGEGISPFEGAMIRHERMNIYYLIKNYLLPEEHLRENEELDVFIWLIAIFMGELRYYIKFFPDMHDPMECPERLLTELAEYLGYHFRDDVRMRYYRVILNNFLAILRRRGTNQSIVNSIRFTGQEEIAFLRLEEGMNVRVQEEVGKGLISIDGANADVDQVLDAVEHVLPAGLKFSYAIRYGVPSVSMVDSFSHYISSELLSSELLPPEADVDRNDVNTINISEEGSLSISISAKDGSREDDLNVGIDDEDASVLSGTIPESKDTLITQNNFKEVSDIDKPGFSRYGITLYGIARYGWLEVKDIEG